MWKYFSISSLLILSLIYSSTSGQSRPSNVEQTLENKIRINELEKKVEKQKQEIEVEIDSKTGELEKKLELQKENLDFRKDSIDRWFYLLGFLLSVFGIGIPILGLFYGKKLLNDIEREKEDARKTIADFINEAKNHIEVLKEQVSTGHELTTKLKELADKATQPLSNLSKEQRNNLSAIAKEVKNEEGASPLEREMGAAFDSFFSDEYSEAISRFLKILESYPSEITIPKLSQIYSYLGYSYSQINKIEESISFYQKALSLDANDSIHWYNLANAYDKKGEKDLAIQSYQESIRLNSKNSDAFNNIGIIYEEQEKYKLALESYKKAIKLRPKKSSDTWDNLGSLYLKTGQFIEALEAFKNAAELEPKNASYWYHYGVANNIIDNYQEAISCFDKAIILKPKYPDSFDGRGVSYVGLKDYNNAIENFLKAIEIDQKYINAYPNVIESFIFTNQISEAQRYLDLLDQIAGDGLKHDFLRPIISKIENRLDQSVFEVINVIKEKGNISELDWDFRAIKIWLNSEQSSFLSQEQNDFISGFVEALEKLISEKKHVVID